MEEVEKLLSKEVNGWYPVNKGGSWKPTECKAKVKVSQLMRFLPREGTVVSDHRQLAKAHASFCKGPKQQCSR